MDWWLTHNEPWCAAFLGYGIGVHAPGIRDMRSAFMAGHHLLLSHGLALPRLRAFTRQTAQVGITLNLGPIYPEDDRPETLLAAKRADAFVNRWFLDPIFFACYPEELFTDLAIAAPPLEDSDLECIASPIDFLGVNYYSRKVVRAPKEAHSTRMPRGFEEVAQVPGASYTQMGAGWEVYPPGLTDLLVRVQRDYAPQAVVVTENGAAFEDAWDGNGAVSDPQRLSYIHEHIQALEQALAHGVPLGGYFLWSLLDNFEWSEGYSKRFGMVYVDYPTQRRIVKESGRWYADFVSSHRRRRK